MEESFEVRVKRLFGSQLFEAVPQSSFPASSWSVADGEVERKEWNRERGAGPDRSDDPCSSAFAEGGCYAKKRSARRGFELRMDALDDDAEEEGRGEVEEEEENDQGDDRDAEVLEMRSFVGLDPTLDKEDEEDEFDRAALGEDDTGERLYMRDVKNHGPHLNYHSIFADVEEESYTGSRRFYKDPRADHCAAGIRLEEDKKAAEIFSVPDHSKDEHPSTSGLVDFTVEDIKLKPILKRKTAQEDLKPKKRVRFDPGCKPDNNEILREAQDSAMFSHVMEAPTVADPTPVILEESPGLPDYMRNPSKYTHYTFDSYDDDDLANISAFEDFHNSYKKLNPEQPYQQVIMELPKSITFNPRRKSIDDMPVDNELGDVQESHIREEFLESDLWVTRSVGIAAGESYESGICKMDEDDLETPISGERVELPRSARKYRSRATSDD
ncbi:uncharacterized protein LOC110020100 [Phalaenopsis equestris]|uniref:uncharacterized protein LOC110020100 n=1 Tax=Phalaenopsis equestris TaxID=78828 RepID=UPI0009E1EB7A|nr:uncharacterized protein LOC110020100 [Phalaenopsis equestris]